MPLQQMRFTTEKNRGFRPTRPKCQGDFQHQMMPVHNIAENERSTSLGEIEDGKRLWAGSNKTESSIELESHDFTKNTSFDQTQ